MKCVKPVLYKKTGWAKVSAHELQVSNEGAATSLYFPRVTAYVAARLIVHDR